MHHNISLVLNHMIKYQRLKNFTRWLIPCMTIHLGLTWGDFANLTSCGHSHHAWEKSPHIHLSCPHVELSPPLHKSHLVWPFSPHVRKVTSCPPHMPSCWVIPVTMQKSPHVTILTSCSNLMLSYHTTTQRSSHVTILTTHQKSHLVPTPHALMLSWPCHHRKVTLHDHSHLMQQSHLACFLPCKNNISHLTWKNSQESHTVTPIPSIRYPLRATNYTPCNKFVNYIISIK